MQPIVNVVDDMGIEYTFMDLKERFILIMMFIIIKFTLFQNLGNIHSVDLQEKSQGWPTLP